MDFFLAWQNFMYVKGILDGKREKEIESIHSTSLFLCCVKVRYLKIIEKSGYQALPWVRYITQNGGERGKYECFFGIGERKKGKKTEREREKGTAEKNS